MLSFAQNFETSNLDFDPAGLIQGNFAGPCQRVKTPKALVERFAESGIKDSRQWRLSRRVNFVEVAFRYFFERPRKRGSLTDCPVKRFDLVSAVTKRE